MVARVTPLTEMLALYRGLHETGKAGLQARGRLGEQLRARPDDLAARFALSVAQFSRYYNPRQFFHAGELADGEFAREGVPLPHACAPVAQPPPRDVQRTVHFAQWAKAAGVAAVASDPPLEFRYVDRELDCMRSAPGQPLEDGTPSKEALRLDLLLEDARDGTPILAELKIRRDEDALYGLIQVLAAGAHLVTAAQRVRLRNVYGMTRALRTGGPYLDLFLIFFEPDVKGEWITVLRHALALRDALLALGAVATLIRRIEFLHATLGADGLRLSRADELAVRQSARQAPTATRGKTPRLEQPTWAGVDVGGRRKGFHCAVVSDTELLELGAARTVEDAVAWLTARRPQLVAVDSPRTPAELGERSRAGERALVAAGICNIRFTPDRAGLAGNPVYYEWIEHGFELYEACVRARLDVIECFPTASWTRWAGARAAARRSDWTHAALLATGLEGLPARLTQDERDAVGAALTARAHAHGLTENFGDIVVPAR